MDDTSANLYGKQNQESQTKQTSSKKVGQTSMCVMSYIL